LASLFQPPEAMQPGQPSVFMTVPSAQFSHRRLVVVTFDWLPAWLLSTWGTTWIATPAFDRLAARGVVLDGVMATSDNAEETLDAMVGRPHASLDAAGGGPTLLVTDSQSVGRGPLGRRFDSVIEEWADLADHCQNDEEETALGQLFRAASDAVSSLTEDGAFLWCHAASLGETWDAPLDLRDCLVGEDDPLPPRSAAVPSVKTGQEADPDLILGVRQAFAGQLMLADRMLGRLVDAVESEARQGRPWELVVAGLRGMPLGLHGQLGVPGAAADKLLPFGDLVQMPVILADAAGRMAGQRFNGLLTADDIGAFVRECLSGAGQSGLHGLLSDWKCSGREYVVSRNESGASVVSRHWRLVVETRQQASGEAGQLQPLLFAKPDDFFEQCDVADRCPEVVEDLSELLSGEP
jgi:hypothetical protein